METKTVKVGNISCGSNKLFLISGPCVIEKESVMLRTAEKLKMISDRWGIPLIFKSSFLKDNRSSLQYYRGPGIDKGLKILQRIKEEFNLPLISDIHEPSHAGLVAGVLDVIQIPAYLCMQTSLILAAANTGKPINLKHGQFLAPANMIKPVQKCVEAGNEQIIVTERGYTFGYNDLIVDPRSFYHLRQTGFPLVFDITHSIRKYGIPSSNPQGGSREYLPTIARAGVAAGVDGLFIETHPNPESALCDASSQLPIGNLEKLIEPLIEIHALEVRYRNRVLDEVVEREDNKMPLVPEMKGV
ncbi:3-deoxy-8-phosphooctulonate synthase [Cytophagales bacterium RKSG123]|nr:3-deoxy-8-phosphooctulonate synthase [Xanthovirga aplysinae]